MKQLLREYLKVTNEHGFAYIGCDGAGHYHFEHDDGRNARAPSSPRNSGDAINNLQGACRRAYRKPNRIRLKDRSVDGNKLFRLFR